MSKKYIADVSSVYGVSEHDKKYLNNCSDNEKKLWLVEQVMNGNIILIECSAEDTTQEEAEKNIGNYTEVTS